MPPLDKADEAVSFVYLQWTTAAFARKDHDIEKKRIDSEALAADEWF